ncbi:MAG: prolyl oligopeptidase family serine peptidase [Lachnospiraceae bacterium]|nr:prolyl oligopeptidase family serine peptidase [Lachnospiraceae bacterium]
MRKKSACLSALAVCVALAGLSSASVFAEEAGAVAADEAIEQVTTIAFMDVDGPKVKAIVVEYNVELTAGSVDVDTYDCYTYANLPQVFDIARDNGGPTEGDEALEPYSTLPTFELQNGEPGAPTNVYVSADPEIDPDGVGDESGNYVIIEVNTDYQLAAVSSDWRACVAGGVQQLVTIESGDVEITASETVVGNYEDGYFWDINPMGSNHSVTLQKVFDDSLYVIEGIEDYQIYTDNVEEEHEEHHDAESDEDRTIDYTVANATVISKVAGGSFQATDCFSEADGELHDVSLMYSIYVPEDYEEQVAAGKQFGLVIHIEDAGALGDDPMLALTECQAAANYASEEVQQLAKDQGLGGLIVVLPQIPKSGQSMADNLTGNEYVPATWQLLDSITETYDIDMNRIYASGQSMGGMQALAMAAERDNYFAAIWAIGSQWGNNYNKEELYKETSYTSYPTDGTIITNEDWENWYYSISDDNILVTNMTGDATATDFWNLTADLFEEYGGLSIPYTEWDPVATSKEDQSALLDELVAQENELGIYWNALSNGSHKATWIYAHAISSSYEWLLQQTKETEDARGKIEALSGSYEDGEGTYLFNTLDVVEVSLD